MRILGIVAEYNPFHLGHGYHLQKAKEYIKPHGVIVVLSSNFLQRGEPALVDKWARTQMALDAGVDLVIELPAAFASRSAMFFALGSIKSLAATGIVTHLAFGSEDERLKDFQEIAGLLNQEPQPFSDLLDIYLKEGFSYPKARNLALQDFIGMDSLALDRPNNILAIAYLRTLALLNSAIEPVIIKRKGNYHSKGLEEGFLSATAIRHHIAHGNKAWENYVPSTTLDILQEQFSLGLGPVYLNNFTEAILAIIRRSNPGYLRRIIEVEEGLENRVWELSQQETSLETLIEKLKTKRYTYTRLQRLLSHILINFTKEDSTEDPQYLRVLGFNQMGKELLKLIKTRSGLPIITKFAHGSKLVSSQGQKLLELEARATDLYALGYPDKSKIKGRQDFHRPPVSS